MTLAPMRLSRIALAATGALAVAALLSGCSDTKRVLGLEKQAPDEFAVVARAPLSMPPDFKLRPPAPGAVRPQEGTPRQQARESVLGPNGGGTVGLAANGRTAGEVSLLRKAGADKADANIRATIDRELAAMVAADASFSDRILFWRDREQPGATLVDATKEAKRIRENQALGEAVTNGETPIIERRQRTLLQSLFD